MYLRLAMPTRRPGSAGNRSFKRRNILRCCVADSVDGIRVIERGIGGFGDQRVAQTSVRVYPQTALPLFLLRACMHHAHYNPDPKSNQNDGEPTEQPQLACLDDMTAAPMAAILVLREESTPCLRKRLPSIAFGVENRYNNEGVTSVPCRSRRQRFRVAYLNPAFFLANSASALSNRLVDALMDNTFSGVYRLQPFDWAIMVPYFAVLLVLSVYGLHRYAMIRGYWKHRGQMLHEAPQKFRGAAARHHPVADLQRAIRSGAVAGRNRQNALSARIAPDSGAGRFHRRDPPLRRAPMRRICRSWLPDSIYSSNQQAWIQSRSSGARPGNCDRRDRGDL